MAGRGRGRGILKPKEPAAPTTLQKDEEPDDMSTIPSSAEGLSRGAPSVVSSEFSESSIPTSEAEDEPPGASSRPRSDSESDAESTTTLDSFSAVSLGPLTARGRAGPGKASFLLTVERAERMKKRQIREIEKSRVYPPVPNPIVIPTPTPSESGLSSTTERSSQAGQVEAVAKPSGSQASSSVKAPVSSTSSIGAEGIDFREAEDPVVSMPGSGGTPAQLACSFIRINFLDTNNKGFQFEYHVQMDPTFDDVKRKREIIKTLSDRFGGIYSYDGDLRVYLPYKTPAKVTTLETKNPSDENQMVRVAFTLVREVKIGDSVQFLNSLLNRVFRILGLTQLKRNFYNLRSVVDIPQHKLEVWPGFISSVVDVEGGLSLRLDASYRVLRTATAWEILMEFKQKGGSEADIQRIFKEYCLNRIVFARYNNRSYKIDDIDYKSSPKSTFKRNGVDITFIDYFKTQYGLTIADPDQPLFVILESKNRPKPGEPRPKHLDPNDPNVKKIVLIPELCYLTGMSDEMRANFTVMKDIAVYTRVTPEVRLRAMNEFMKNVLENEEAKKVFSDWGLELDSKVIEFGGRTIGGPSLLFNEGEGVRTITSANADFSRDVANNRCRSAIKIEKFLIFTTRFDSDKARNLLTTYSQTAKKFGIGMGEGGQIIEVQGKTINDFRVKMKQFVNDQIQFIIVVMPGPGVRDDLYAAIKKFALCENSLPSQVMLSKTLGNEKRFRSVMEKVVLQINCKLGGSLWGLKIPLNEKIMIVGMDVFHDPKGKKKSCVAIIASLNNECTQYYSTCIFQTERFEVVTAGIFVAFNKALDAFVTENGSYPQRIIMYRDGVSDGQLDHVIKNEVPQFKDVLKTRMGEGIPTKFTYVVVQKRINERFYQMRKQGNTTIHANPEAGTIIDTVATRKKYFDFFVVSQKVTQGTVTPTHYIVVYDNSEIKANLIQKFTYSLTFMYFNWTGTIRVPSPCQYAHKLATLVGTHLGGVEPKSQMNRKLYYL